MGKAKAALEALINNSGTEAVGYAATDVNTALLAAKVMAEDAFPGVTIVVNPNDAASPRMVDPGIVLQIAEMILTRLPAIELAETEDPEDPDEDEDDEELDDDDEGLDDDDEGLDDDEGGGDEGDDDPPVEVVR